MMMPDADLERFHDGYRRHFDQALTEINGQGNDDCSSTVAKANEILDQAETQGLPRCASTQRFLAGDARP